MIENYSIQSSKPVTAISNNDQIRSFVSKNDSNEMQLQYDEAEENVANEELEKAVNKINEHLLGVNTQFQYKIHEGTERIMVKLIDTESNEVIKEIPPEKMLDMVAEIWKRVGLVVDNQE
ncbi:flagellar protein FlaG [Desemzia sp. FAM 23991]|uniref:flagellar protein FlaG n=1 Tax=unclassified Desemzia TaxID=2685243 RepID=UPI0038877D3D